MNQIDRAVPRWLALALAVAVIGCSSTTEKPTSLPPQTITSPKLPDAPDDAATAAAPNDSAAAEMLNDLPPELGALEAQPPPDEPMNSEESLPPREASSGTTTVVDPDKKHARDDPTLVIINEYIEDETPQDVRLKLMQASLQERERRRTAASAVVEINDKNLAEFAEGGNLTYVSGPAPDAPDAPALPTGAIAAEEEFWRTGARTIRLNWRESVDRLKQLEADAAGLRRRFYAVDDPFVRDGQIKPAWDRSLDLIEEEKTRIEGYKRELAEFLEDGRRAGALPGWLREGVNLEPVREENGELPEVDPQEPKVINN